MLIPFHVFFKKNLFFSPRVDFVCCFHIEFNLLSLCVIVYAYGLHVCLSELGQPLPPPSRAHVGAVFDFCCVCATSFVCLNAL